MADDNKVKSITATSIAQGFIDRKRPTDAIKRRLAKSYMPTLDKLEAMAENPKTSEKTVVTILKFLCTEYRDVLNQDSNDRIKRLELQLKYYGVDGLPDAEFSTDEDDEDDVPQAMSFDKVIEIE